MPDKNCHCFSAAASKRIPTLLEAFEWDVERKEHAN